MVSWHNIETDTIQISGNGGDQIDAYLAQPKGQGRRLFGLLHCLIL